MEQTHPNIEAARQSSEAAERQSEALNQEAETTLSHLDSSWDIDATQYLVSSVTELSPAAHADFCSRQAAIWNSLLSQLQKQNEVAHEVPQDIIAYFNLDAQAISQLQESLDPLRLDISRLLSSFKNYIETRLADLPEEHRAKIRKSIGIKTWNIWDIVEEIKSETKSDEEFRSMRWILNEKIWDAFNFYTEELFPSLELMLTLQEGAQVPESVRQQYLGSGSIRDGTRYHNPRYVNIDWFMEEISELLEAPVDEDGDFDEGFFSTQNILSTHTHAHAELFEDMNIQSMESISLLNEADRQIENNAMIAYFLLIGIQMIPYAGAPIWLYVDGIDAFSDEDGTLALWQQLWLIHDEFRMEKNWYDNVLWGVWIALTAVWLQGITRARRISDSFPTLQRVWFDRIEDVLIHMWEKLWITTEAMQSLRDYFRNLFGWNVDEANDIIKTDETRNIEVNSIPEETLEALEELWIPREFYELVEESWLFSSQWGIPMNVISRFERLRERNWIDLNTHIEAVMRDIPWLTRTEAYVIFSYTDNFLYRNLNELLRSGAELTPWQQRLVDILNSWLEKMPNYSWDTILLRGDSWEEYIHRNIWETITLWWYSSVSNRIDDTFIWEWYSDNFLVQITWLEWRIKDITSLWIAPQFGDRIVAIWEKTWNEWVMLMNSRVRITNRETATHTFENWETIEILTISVEQIQ